MLFLINLAIFVLGLAVGSFLNCVIYRLEEEKSLDGRSFCPHCKHTLCWRDLVPIFSFLTLGGKCRYCKGKISWQYPLVEIATGLLFLLILNFKFVILNKFLIYNFEDILTVLYLLVIACFLIVIFVYDLKHYIIPDKFVYPAVITVFLYLLIFKLQAYGSLPYILSAFGASAFLLAIFLISSGRWIGFGDVKLAFFMGFFLGYPNILVALFLAFFLGAIIGIGLIFLGKKALKSEVPFGPFLIIGTVVSLFLGDTIVNWYVSLL